MKKNMRWFIKAVRKGKEVGEIVVLADTEDLALKRATAQCYSITKPKYPEAEYTTLCNVRVEGIKHPTEYTYSFYLGATKSVLHVKAYTFREAYYKAVDKNSELMSSIAYTSIKEYEDSMTVKLVWSTELQHYKIHPVPVVPIKCPYVTALSYETAMRKALKELSKIQLSPITTYKPITHEEVTIDKVSCWLTHIEEAEVRSCFRYEK